MTPAAPARRSFLRGDGAWPFLPLPPRWRRRSSFPYRRAHASYEVEIVLVGLSMPTGMGFADDGTLYLLEGGTTPSPRPYVPARILRLDPSGRLDAIAGLIRRRCR